MGKDVLVVSWVRDVHQKRSSVEKLTEAPGEAQISPREGAVSGEGSQGPWEEGGALEGVSLPTDRLL